ncbi:MAG: hypothetical protein IJ197_07725 [Bacteroidaceae bacterium]|nr:hypothetical protein [Bacteroidaceae bacterium]
MMKSRLPLLLSLLFLVASCESDKSPEGVAERFLSNYLELHFKRAARVASPEVVEQMRWRASNLTQAEVELLAQQEEPADIDVEDVVELGDSCIVVLTAHDALVADSIDRPAYIGSTRYRVTLKKKKGDNWMVTALSL